VGGECTHPVAEIHEKRSQKSWVSFRVLSCIIRKISFLLFKSSYLGLIFKKYAFEVPYTVVFEILYVKVKILCITKGRVIGSQQPTINNNNRINYITVNI